MIARLALFLPLAVCLGSPVVTEEQLRSLVKPMLDAELSPKVTADSPPLFASLAAVSPLDKPVLAAPPQDLASQVAHASTANQQQVAQLNLAGGLDGLIRGALGALLPGARRPESPNTAGPVFGSPATPTGAIFPSTGGAQPTPARQPLMNWLNPFRFLFSGMGGNPLGMFSMSMGMRMLETMMELF